MIIIEKDIKDLKPYEKNPRKNENAVKYVANSIKKFGFKVPIIVDSNNVIIAGHTRYKAALKLEIKRVPCIVADDLTPKQVKAFRLADNKVGEIAEWDFDLLDEELDSILDFNMEDFGFDLSDLEEKEIIEDELPQINTETPPISKSGDIWQLGNHRLMCGDATKQDDVALLMNGAKADMVFTDPPYGVSYTEKNEFLNSIGGGNRLTNAIKNDCNAPDQMYDFWKTCLKNILDATTDKSSYYLTGPQGGDLLLLFQALKDSGWALKHNLIWNKNNHVLGRCDYNYKHEPIIFGWKQNGTHNFYGNGEMKTSVWDIPKPLKSDLHPTMKPIKLISECLLNSSKKGDKVIDIFGGSGSTLIACEQLDRKCYMLELEPKYCDVIIKRWETLTGKKAKLLN